MHTKITHRIRAIQIDKIALGDGRLMEALHAYNALSKMLNTMDLTSKVNDIDLDHVEEALSRHGVETTIGFRLRETLHVLILELATVLKDYETIIQGMIRETMAATPS